MIYDVGRFSEWSDPNQINYRINARSLRRRLPPSFWSPFLGAFGDFGPSTSLGKFAPEASSEEPRPGSNIGVAVGGVPVTSYASLFLSALLYFSFLGMGSKLGGAPCVAPVTEVDLPFLACLGKGPSVVGGAIGAGVFPTIGSVGTTNDTMGAPAVGIKAETMTGAEVVGVARGEFVIGDVTVGALTPHEPTVRTVLSLLAPE